ncbi:MAG: ATP-binding protein, partial [Chloroflexota bacterium]
GYGIESEAVDKIFEPFFSTKQSGTGLGLAVSHGIVIEHGGRLHAQSPAHDSAKKPGTAITVVLPLPALEQVEES